MAPSKTADTKSILFIHSIRRDRPTKVHREDEVFGKFCLNKCEGKTSGAQVKKTNRAQVANKLCSGRSIVRDFKLSTAVNDRVAANPDALTQVTAVKLAAP